MAERPRYTLDDGRIEASPNEPVEVVVQGAGTSGYEWQVEAKEDEVRVLDHVREARGSSFGAAARETFVLQPTGNGETQVRFVLKRPWESEPAESHTLTIRTVE